MAAGLPPHRSAEDRHDVPPGGALGQAATWPQGRRPAAGPRPPRPPVGRARPAGAAEPRAAPPAGARHAGTGWSRPSTGTGTGLLTHEFFCGAAREQAARLVARSRRPRCTSWSPPATPPGCSPRGLAGDGQERRHRAAGRDPAEKGRAARVQLAHLGPGRRAPALGRTCRPSGCTCCRCPAGRAGDRHWRNFAGGGRARPRVPAPGGAGATRRWASSRSSCCAGSTRTSRLPQARRPGPLDPRLPRRAAPGGPGGERFGPTTTQVADCRRRAERAVRMIDERGYDVVGDVESLRVPADASDRPGPDAVSSEELLESATTLVADMLTDVRAGRRARRRTAGSSLPSVPPPETARVSPESGRGTR